MIFKFFHFFQIYTFLTYIFKILYNNLQIFLAFSIFNLSICTFVCIELGKEDILTSYIGLAYGFFIIFSSIAISVEVLLFTIAPFALLRFFERRKTLVVKNSVFTKNRFVQLGSLLGLFLYLVGSLFCLVITTYLFLTK